MRNDKENSLIEDEKLIAKYELVVLKEEKGESKDCDENIVAGSAWIRLVFVKSHVLWYNFNFKLI